MPLYTSRSGKRWSTGQVIIGTHFGTYPADSIIKFPQSQEAQSPKFLEPAGSLSATPTRCRHRLRYLPPPRRQLHRLWQCPASILLRQRDPDELTVFLDPSLLHNTTIASILSSHAFHATQVYSQRCIGQNLALLLRETPSGEKTCSTSQPRSKTSPTPGHAYSTACRGG
ncbi:hypothetical protein VTI74DRAFT_9394 [Chaetomium olivicolor]